MKWKKSLASLFYQYKMQFRQHSFSSRQTLWLKVCCSLYNTFQIVTAQRVGRATHWLCREGMDISSPCFLKLWVSIRNWSRANHCYSRSPLDESSSGPELWVRSNEKVCRGIYGQFFSQLCIASVSMIVQSHPVFNHFSASVFFPLFCEHKVGVSSSLLSEFSLWQGDSGFVMRGV